MNNSFTIYHYHSLSKWRIFPRIYKRLLNDNVEIILDLEDSVGDPFSEQRTFDLKQQAREGLKEISIKPFWSKVKDQIWIRVNSFQSQYFHDDFKVISLLVKNQNLYPKINLTKVETTEEILFTAKEFKEKFSKQFDLHIIIETIKGWDNLDKILNAISCLDLENQPKIGLGFFDYSLDANLFPFSEYNHQGYWDLILPFKKKVEKYSFMFVAPPINYTTERPLLEFKAMLLANSESPFGMVSIGENQTDVLLKSVSPKLINLVKRNLDLKQKQRLAQEVIEKFEQSRRENSDRSFALTETGRFIPPHEYKAAVNFLISTESIGKDISD